jgi:predicted DNA binding protein
MSTSDMLKTEGAQKDTSFLPFLISYDGAEQYVLYAKSESQIKIELRKIYRPENFKKIEVKRLYPNEVIQFYWKKRQQALRAE